MRTPLAVVAALIATLACTLVATASLAAGAATDLAATPSALTSTAPVTATAGLPASGATNGVTQLLTQSFDPAYLWLDGAAQVTAPEGWTTTYSTDGTTFGAAPATPADWAAVRAVRTTGTATGTAATGGTESASVPAPPSSAFSGGGGGDGWNVVFDNGGHVFNVWHHNGSPWPGRGYGSIDCHTRTGATCGNGWPFDATGGGLQLATGMHSAGWVDAASGHLWFPTNTSGTATGFACVDVSNLGSGAGQGPAWCGGTASSAFKALGTGGPTGFNDQYAFCSIGWQSLPFNCVDGLAVSGRRAYTLETRTGKVLCVDMAANGGGGGACTGQPYVVPGMTAAPIVALQGVTEKWLPALLSVEGRIFATGRDSYTSSTAPVYLACLEGATGAACPGWATPKTIGTPTAAATTPWLAYAEPSASGAINGVCVRPVTASTTGTPACFDVAGAPFTGDASIAGSFRHTVRSENASAVAATAGSRVYWGNGDYDRNTSVLYCSDAATHADCAGWPVLPATAGAVRRDNYVVTPDPGNADCLWANSDASGIYQYNSAGTRGCDSTAPPSATFTASGLVNPQRVGCTGQPTWGTLSITSPAVGTYASATLTVLRSTGAVVSSGGTTWVDQPIGADGTIDLAGLAQADTGSNPQFVVNFAGRTGTAPFAPIATSITAPQYAPQLCITLTPREVACPISGAPAGSLQAWTSAIDATGAQGGTPLDPAQAMVDFANAATATCAPPPPPPPAPVPPASATERAAPPAPTTSAPAISPSGTAILTSVSVSTPGVITQRGTRATGAPGCTSRPVTMAAPGSTTVACRINGATLARLARAPVRLRLVTVLRTATGATSRSVRSVLLRRRVLPVTG